MQTREFLTCRLKGYNFRVTVKAFGPLVLYYSCLFKKLNFVQGVPCTGMHQTQDHAQFCMSCEIICLNLLQRWIEMETSVAVDTA